MQEWMRTRVKVNRMEWRVKVKGGWQMQERSKEARGSLRCISGVRREMRREIRMRISANSTHSRRSGSRRSVAWPGLPLLFILFILYFVQNAPPKSTRQQTALSKFSLSSQRLH